jgi:23S rRNA pseudouridine1911/1915/1917 synthase
MCPVNLTPLLRINSDISLGTKKVNWFLWPKPSRGFKWFKTIFLTFNSILSVSFKANDPYIVFEDNHLIVVVKPAGLLVQGDNTGDPTLTDWVRDYIQVKYKKPGAAFAHPVHRIDRPVSGIVVFARTSKALERMSKQFHDDVVKKSYLAIVQGVPKESEILTHFLVKDSITNTVRAFGKAKKGAKESVLAYDHIGTVSGHSLIKIYPKTGRPHQIRVQLSTVGHPIAGDVKYKYPNPNPDKSISLHAWKLSFVHPVKNEPIKLSNRPKSSVWYEFKELISELD